MIKYKSIFKRSKLKESENRYGQDDGAIPEVDHLEVQLSKLLRRLFQLQGFKTGISEEQEVYSKYREIIRKKQNEI